jgi:hypothetical protein
MYKILQVLSIQLHIWKTKKINIKPNNIKQ